MRRINRADVGLQASNQHLTRCHSYFLIFRHLAAPISSNLKHAIQLSFGFATEQLGCLR